MVVVKARWLNCCWALCKHKKVTYGALACSAPHKSMESDPIDFTVAQALRSYLADHATTSQLAKLDAYIAANTVTASAANDAVYNYKNERKVA